MRIEFQGPVSHMFMSLVSGDRRGDRIDGAETGSTGQATRFAERSRRGTASKQPLLRGGQKFRTEAPCGVVLFGSIRPGWRWKR